MLASNVVSLSHGIHPSMPVWPGDPPVEFHSVANLEQDGFFLRCFSMGEHSGTHVNAPAGFHPKGAGIETYPPASLVVPAVVMDVRSAAQGNPDYLLDVDRTLAWEKQYGTLPAGSLLLLFTGWQDKWNYPAAYLGFADPADGRLHFPGFGLDVAELLLTRRRMAGLGIDTPGLDGGQDTAFAVNRLVLECPRLAPENSPPSGPPTAAQEWPRIALENLTNLDRLPPTGATLVIGVLPLQGGSGSPAAVTAFLP